MKKQRQCLSQRMHQKDLANMSYVGSVNVLSAFIGLDLYEQAVKKGNNRIASYQLKC